MVVHLAQMEAELGLGPEQCGASQGCSLPTALTHLSDMYQPGCRSPTTGEMAGPDTALLPLMELTGGLCQVTGRRPRQVGPCYSKDSTRREGEAAGGSEPQETRFALHF
jgi:hypothetical protein